MILFSVPGPLDGNGNSGGGDDSPLSFSCHTWDKATKAKMTLENYYSNLISQHQERRSRWQRLEASLKDDSIPEERKIEKRAAHAVRETEFLRLKRSRLGADDFDQLKVGRGNFLPRSFSKREGDVGGGLTIF